MPSVVTPNGVTNSTNTTILQVPTGRQDGDIMICITAGQSAAAQPQDTGSVVWTLLHSINNGGNQYIRIEWATWNTGGPTSIACLGGGGQYQNSMVLVRGAGPATPVLDSSENASSLDPASLSYSSADVVVIAAAADAAKGGSFTQPTNYTEWVDAATNNDGPSANSHLGVASRELTASTGEDPGAFTGSSGGGPVSVAVALAAGAMQVTVPLLTSTSTLYAPTLEFQPTSTSVGRITIGSYGTPPTSYDHAINIRGRVTSGAGSAVFKVALYEGSTNVSGDIESSALTTSIADYNIPISAALAANINSYVGLELRFWGYDPSGGHLTYQIDRLSLFVPALQSNDQTLILGLLDGSATLYAPTVISDQDVTLGLLDGSAALYAPTVTQITYMSLPLLRSGALLYQDDFDNRTVSNSLGTSSDGTDWSNDANWNVGSGVAYRTFNDSSGNIVSFDHADVTNTRVRILLGFDRDPATGADGHWFHIHARDHVTPDDLYAAAFRFLPNGDITCRVDIRNAGVWDWTVIGSDSTPVETWTDLSTEKWWLEYEVTGDQTHELRVWLDGTPRPSTATLSGTSSGTPITTGGTTGWRMGTSDTTATLFSVYTHEVSAPGAVEYGPVLFGPTVEAQAVNIVLPQLDGGATLYAPNVLSEQTLDLGLIDGASTLYAPTVVQTLYLTLPLLGEDYASATLADGDLLAYWRFNDTGSTAVDQTGNYDGTIDTATERSQPGLIASADNAFGFPNSTSAGVSIPSGMDPWDSAFTLECWATTDIVDSNYRGIMSKEVVSTNGFRFGQRSTSNGWGFWTTQSGGTIALTSGSTPTLGRPYHLVITWNGSDTFTFYVDGLEVGSDNTGTYIAPTGGLSIGWFSGGNWNGDVDEVAVYTAEKDATWAAARHALGITGAVLYTPTVEPQAATLTLGLLDSGPTLFAPVVEAGQTIDLGLLDSGSALYAPDVTTENDVTLGLLDAGSALYAPAFTLESAITIGLLDSTSALYAPTFAVGPVDIVLGLLDAGATTYAPTITAGPVTITLGLLDSTSALYAPTITYTSTITLGLLDAGSATYAPTIATINDVSLGLLDSSSALYAPDLLQVQAISLGLLDGLAELYAPGVINDKLIQLGTLTSASALYAPQIDAGSLTISLDLLTSTSAQYAPTITTENDLDLGLLTSTSALYSPTFTTENDIDLGLLDGSLALYSPDLSYVIDLGLLTSTSALYAPTVLATNDVTVDLLTSTSTLYDPTLSATNDLSLGLLTSTSALYAPGILAEQLISLDLITSTSALYEMTVEFSVVCLHPDADLETTGWSATPLWSKIDEDHETPDGVVITATAS